MEGDGEPSRETVLHYRHLGLEIPSFRSQDIKFSSEPCKSEAQPLLEDKFGEVMSISEQNLRRISISVKGRRKKEQWRAPCLQRNARGAQSPPPAGAHAEQTGERKRKNQPTTGKPQRRVVIIESYGFFRFAFSGEDVRSETPNLLLI
ncbi:hypothetical protein MG293_007988 [Ovis ammon polii]|uniref:Uncharacterized protein n=1 Tax=Ovis ammon polii TaxID=230172 RepID=A0AAD4UDB2_OVIAM|nr:hypothetical protein MG293_007988 [Ovis ammon polii]